MIESTIVTGQPCSVCYSDSLNNLVNDVSYCSECRLKAYPSESSPPKKGGKRTGAGRPKGGGKWGSYEGKLTRVWVPAPVAHQLPEFVQSVQELLENFDAMTADYPDSPRKKLARQIVEELKDVVGLIQ